MYKLFYSPGACSLAVHILLEEIGDPYTLEEISVKKGRTQSPEYLTVNPKGRVPALLAEGHLLTEAPAILVYLALTHPEKLLLPNDPMNHFRCLEWLNWLTSTVHSVGYGQYWRPQRFIGNQAQYAAVSAKGKENILDSYRYIEQQVKGRTWSVGESYSCVDPFLLVFYIWGNLIGVRMRTEFPAWSLLTDRVVERRPVQRALDQEGLPRWICVDPVSSTLASIAGKFSV